MLQVNIGALKERQTELAKSVSFQDKIIFDAIRYVAGFGADGSGRRGSAGKVRVNIEY